MKYSPDDIQRLLEVSRQSNVNLFENYCNAHLSGTLPAYYVKRLQHFKGTPVGEQTCQDYDRIIGIGLELEQAVDDEVIADKAVEERITEFRNRSFNVFNRPNGYTTPEEIDYINNTLDFVVQHIQKRI
jgi:hypothetical protein